MRRLRIFHVLSSLVVGGMERLTVDLAVTMTRRGHEVRVVTLDGAGPMDAYARASAVRVENVDSRGWRTLVGRSPLSQYLERERPDIVHSHGGCWARAVAAAARANVEGRVHTIHGFHEREVAKMLWLDRASLRLTRATVVVSEELREQCARALWTDADRIRFIRNGVPGFPVGKSPMRRSELGLSGDHLVVIAVGRLVPVKGLDVLLSAFALVQKDAPMARLVLVGEGPERARLSSQIASLGLEDVVHMLGQRNDTARLLQMSDIFCLPSRSEGLSISLLEAMAAGLPVVATGVGATPEVVTGDVGIVVPPESPVELADALEALLNDPARRAAHGSAAREAVALRYSIDRTADEYCALYETTLKR